MNAPDPPALALVSADVHLFSQSCIFVAPRFLRKLVILPDFFQCEELISFYRKTSVILFLRASENPAASADLSV